MREILCEVERYGDGEGNGVHNEGTELTKTNEEGKFDGFIPAPLRQPDRTPTCVELAEKTDLAQRRKVPNRLKFANGSWRDTGPGGRALRGPASGDFVG